MLSKPKDYDVFVSYCEDTGESYAGAIKRAFAHRNFTTFVSGLDKLYIEGKWEEFIDNVIRKCKIFVLLLTIDALESEQVRRELDQLRLKGIDSKNFWIIRLDIPEVPRDSECVNKIVASKLSDLIQFDFENESTLITNLLRHYDGAYAVGTATTAHSTLTSDLIKSNYVILDPAAEFSEGDINCWKTGLFTFNDIHSDYDAERPIIQQIDKALENKSVILFGGPHSGKTMILRRIAIRKIKANYHVIYIEDYKDDWASLVKLVESAVLNKLRLFIIIDNIHNSLEVLRAYNNCHGVRFLFAGIKHRIDIIIQEYHSREDIKQIKRALSDLQYIELEFLPQDAVALWIKVNFLLGRHPIDEENGKISFDISLPMEGLNYYTQSQSDMLIFFAYIKSHLFEGRAGDASIDILENDFIQKWNSLNKWRLRRAAIFCSFMSIFGIKISHQIVTKCKLRIEDLIELVKKDLLVTDSAGNFHIAHEKWASEFLAYIYKSFYLEDENTNRYGLSFKDVIQCVYNCLGLNDLFQAFNSCVYLYYTERYRHVIDTAVKVSRLTSFEDLNKEDSMKILADGVGGFYFDVADYQKAIDVNEEAIQVYNSSPIPWDNKGIALDNLDRYDEALDCYNKAIELDNTYAPAWAGRGIALRNKGPTHFAEAHNSFDNAIKYDPRKVKAWEHKGITYRWQGRYKEALKCYKKALKADEFSDRIWYDIGVLYSGWLKSRRNYIILLYTISFSLISMNVIISMIYLEYHYTFTKSAFRKPYPINSYVIRQEITPWSESLATTYDILSLLSFSVIWVATISLLSQYRYKLGRAKYFALLSIPLIYYLFPFQSYFGNIFSSLVVTSPVAFGIIYVLTFSATKQVGALLFSLAFWTASTLVAKERVRKSLLISAIGMAFLFGSIDITVLQYRLYPPFGLVTQAFIPIGAFMLFIGIFTSATGVAKDAELRKEFYKSARSQLNLLKTIGVTQMENELLKEYKPMLDRSKILEKYEDQQIEQQDVKKIIHDVLTELQSRENQITKSRSKSNNKM